VPKKKRIDNRHYAVYRPVIKFEQVPKMFVWVELSRDDVTSRNIKYQPPIQWVTGALSWG